MYRSYSFILTLVLVLAAHNGAAGQEDALDCPKLEVVGPTARVVPGDAAVFTVNVLALEGLSYKWEVSNGVIESATSVSIVVRTSEADNGVELRATVTVIGFPAGCPSTAEATTPVERHGPRKSVPISPAEGLDAAARQIECPEITVTSPAGIVPPGDVAVFKGSVIGNVPVGAKRSWTVTGGTIIEGQDTDAIRVLTPRNGYQVSVTFYIEVSDERCGNRKTERIEFWGLQEPILLDEFSMPVTEIPHDALKRAVDQHRKNVASSLYIIEYFPLSVSERAIEMKLWQTKAYMSSELGYGPAVIAAVKGDKPFTKIYLIPPGAEYPDY